MEEDIFRTISIITESLYKEKGSKFIGLAYPVKSLDEIKAILEELRKKYYDARHYCYAYILGHDSSQYRANDDGEPNHSAGDPILGQIRSKNITNTLVVVVRYFGGTKLGVSGLINAYKIAASEALEANEIVEVVIKEKVAIRYGYENTNEVLRLIKEFELEILEQNFTIDCQMELAVRKSLQEQLLEKLRKLEGVSLNLE